MKSKAFGIIGIVISLVLVVCGIVVMAGALGGDTHYPEGAGYLYDSGYAQFGADFYNFVSNNAAEAAAASRTAAYNLAEISELLKNSCGIFLIGFGLLGFCYFGMKTSDSNSSPEKVEEPQSPAAPAQNDELPEL